MVYVQVFNAYNQRDLQSIINLWLMDQQRRHDIYIINTTQSESEYSATPSGWHREITYTIIYKKD